MQRRPAPRQSGDRRLVRLDTEAIRTEALKSYRKAKQSLNKARRELDTFRDRDLPGFRTWVCARFGAELTRQRDLQQSIAEKRALLLEVEDIVVRFRLSESAAYRKVLWRRAHPDEAEAEDRALAEQLRDARADAARDECAGGGDGDDFSEGADEGHWDDVDDDGFRAFFEKMTGFRLPPRPPSRERRQGSGDATLKDVYRTIVRRLHPDRSGSFNEAEKQLWHAAQAAYRRGDLPALQQVLAHCEEGAAGIGRHSAVSLVRRLIRDIQAQVRALRAELRAARKDPAWDFAKRGATVMHELRVRSDMEEFSMSLAWDLKTLDQIIAKLERPPSPRPQRPQRRRPEPCLEQYDLPF